MSLLYMGWYGVVVICLNDNRWFIFFIMFDVNCDFWFVSILIGIFNLLKMFISVFVICFVLILGSGIVLG